MMQESLGTLVAQSKLFRMSRLVVLLEQRNAVFGRFSKSRFPICDSISGIQKKSIYNDAKIRIIR